MTGTRPTGRHELDIVREHSAGTPVDIAVLIRDLGVRYLERAMEPGEAGRIDRRADGCTITVNTEQGSQRRRFSAAHAVAHYLLHRDLLDEHGHVDRLFSVAAGFDRSAITPLHDAQANRLAAGLMMPGPAVRHWHGTAPTLAALARRFDVSAPAMRIRVRTLGLQPLPDDVKEFNP